MGKLGDVLGFDAAAEVAPEENLATESVAEEKPKGGSAEVMAMKMFSKASSPEAKVAAMKAFLEACGAIGSDY
jgi:hypothetical protein